MNSSKNQYIVTFYVNLLSFGYGLSTGWTSAALPLLQSKDNPLPVEISRDDGSIIGSILTVGGFFGTICFGYLMNVIGRKWTLYLVAFPQIIGWIAMYFAQSATLLIFFRFLAGFAAGGIFTVMPIFITEISQDE
jgi:MFS family permease